MHLSPTSSSKSLKDYQEILGYGRTIVICRAYLEHQVGNLLECGLEFNSGNDAIVRYILLI